VSKPAPLPWHARAALVSCTVLAGLVGLSTSEEMVRLRRLSEIEHVLPPNSRLPEALQARAEEVMRASLFGMQNSRMVVLGLLCLASTATFVAVLWLWLPLGLPRGGMLRLTSLAALGCALLRIVEGAQLAVVFRRMAIALIQAGGAELRPDVPLVVQVARTLVVAGVFAGLSQYFRSPAARKLFTAGDPSSP